jgi:hypothetical protein
MPLLAIREVKSTIGILWCPAIWTRVCCVDPPPPPPRARARPRIHSLDHDLQLHMPRQRIGQRLVLASFAT